MQKNFSNSFTAFPIGPFHYCFSVLSNKHLSLLLFKRLRTNTISTIMAVCGCVCEKVHCLVKQLKLNDPLGYNHCNQGVKKTDCLCVCNVFKCMQNSKTVVKIECISHSIIQTKNLSFCLHRYRFIRFEEEVKQLIFANQNMG